jgi:hypothetical protein
MPSITRTPRTIPLALVPALAALLGCGSDAPPPPPDPCLPSSYAQQSCELAVQQHGYRYGGTWYPHVYAYSPLYYYNGYSHYVAAGGRASAVAPSGNAPSAARSTVVRGGFGGIGAAHASAGS